MNRVFIEIFLYIVQIPDKSQRFEELAIKQSRQLIPVTPSMPKPLVKGVSCSFLCILDDILNLYAIMHHKFNV